MHVDLAFNLIAAGPIPADHGYPLYAALSRVLPAVHAENGIGIHPIRGRQLGNRQLHLTEHSRLVIRTQAERIPQLLPLAGKQIALAGRRMRIGVPEVRTLVPAAALRSRIVTIKLKELPQIPKENDEDARRLFGEAVRRKLDSLGLVANPEIDLRARRTVRIKDKEVVGYEVILRSLTAADSLAVQENGDPSNPHAGFSRRHMGCAVFLPLVNAD